MKKAFTLIELLVVLSIVTLLLTSAVPIYDKQILKARSDEAKAMIQAISFAQERYKQETGYFYPKNTNAVKNENLIALNLKINLNKSNNFNYFITGANDGLSFTIKAVLRNSSWNTDCNTTASTLCKQDDTIDENNWTTSYATAEDKHYLLYTYPSLIDNDFSESGISYEFLYTGD